MAATTPTPEGTPVWADAMFPDLEGAKNFYGEVLGWTFAESAPEFGGYTQALKDGKAVAAVVPQMPGMEDQPAAWGLYLHSPDIKATAAKIVEHGGEVEMEPMEVGPFGTMLLAKDPAGVYFSVWQPGEHKGFELEGEPGSFCWAEVNTRDAEKTDSFFPAVFGYQVKKMVDEHVDFHIWDLGDKTVLGRMKMGDDYPPEVPPYINVYFAVDDCDAAVEKAKSLGGAVHFGPMSSPFGRFAALTDQQGAAFSVLDPNTTEGEEPQMTS